MTEQNKRFHPPRWLVFAVLSVLIALFWMPSASAASGGDPTVDWAGLSQYLGEQFAVCETEIDISAYKITRTDENKARMSSLIYYEMPEYFHLNNGHSLSYITNTNIYTTLKVTYRCTAEEYAEQREACEAVVEQLTRDLRNNTMLTDVQKALLLHDRLAVHCAYTQGDLNAPRAHTMYGALVERNAVCEGYTKAYDYLLEQVGIESDYCSSDALNHAWNIVYLDGKPYHVDVTKDDPIPDQIGRVMHKRFLLSSEALAAVDKHTCIDYDTSPTDTTYDNGFWQSSTTAFQLVNGAIYYISDNTARANTALKRYGEDTVLVSLNDTWNLPGGYIYTDNYAKLSSDGTRLFYSLSDGIYEYDPVTQETKPVHTPDLSMGDYYSVYGFRYEDGYLIYAVDNDLTDDVAAIEVRVPYPTYKLTGCITAYDPQTAITLTLLQNGIAVRTVELAADSSGSGKTTRSFTLDGIKAGTYALLINKAEHLACRITDLTLTQDIDLTESTNAALANITLHYGDVNNDARIDIRDVALLRSLGMDPDGDGICGKTDVAIIRSTENYYICADDCVIAYP